MSAPHLPPSSSATESHEPTGRKVVFWLFVALSIATAAALLIFAQTVEERFRTRVYLSLAADLLIPVVAWFAIKAIEKRRRRTLLE